MRATGNPPTPAQIAIGIWDLLVSGHTASSTFGGYLKDVFIAATAMNANYARRTPYTYDASLAGGATYVPVAGTVVAIAALDGGTANDFKIMHGAIEVMSSGDNIATNPLIVGYIGMLYCDGTEVGIKNADAGAHDLKLEGFTI